MNIAELFARDPRQHTDADIVQIVTELRAARSRFIVDGKPSAKLTSKEAEMKRIDVGVKL
jgi:hypothetical protein